MPTLLDQAINLAVAAHASAEDPPGTPYILHPLRVLAAVSASDDSHQDEALQCVAILHDVLERTATRPGQLRKAGMPASVVRAVKLLTHGKGVSYAAYVVRLKRDRLAQAVKIADLLDNADLRRVTFRPGKLKKDVPRLIRYAASYQFLTDQITRREYLQVMKKTQ